MSTNEELYFSLIERHHPMICHVCHWYSLGDRYHYEELFQEVRVALWKEIDTYGLSRFRHQSCETTWIYRIVCNTILTYRRNHIDKHAKEIINSRIIEGLPSSDKQDVEEQLEEVLLSLPLNDRRLLMLSLAGYNYAEIADMENMTPTNVGTHLHRIRNRLKKKLHPKE